MKDIEKAYYNTFVCVHDFGEKNATNILAESLALRDEATAWVISAGHMCDTRKNAKQAPQKS